MAKTDSDQNLTIQQLEAQTLQFWKEHNIFEKSVSQRSNENLYVFYDGPPFISGLPHYGHLLGSIAKDVIPRYWTMKGKRVERVWGWDAHGLTVESKVQKELKIKSRKDIEAFGLEKFVEACYAYTSKTSAEWQWYIDKIGRWVDMEHAYKTIDQTYMESVMWAFKQLYDKNLIYQGVRTSFFCTTCGTPVSNFEIAMDNTYKDFEDPAITVAFKVLTKGNLEGVNILAWTTTPWTIPSNRALVLDENETYVEVEYSSKRYIVAEKRYPFVFKDLEGAKLLKTVSGKDLLGLQYEPPFKIFANNDKDFHVYTYPEMVNMEDGTGIVHCAPGFGEVDSEMGQATGLTMMFSIDNEGKFIQGDAAENPYFNIYYTKANPIIKEDLAKLGVLFAAENIIHRVPYHDRCDTVLIQKAQNSWFVNIAKIKNQLIDNNKDINWVPSHLKNGRFEIGINQAPDWCISRSRFWATPMPVWESSDGDRIVVGSIKELEELSGQKVKDLHRPYIDQITISKNNKEYKRVPDVLDSWFEAGSMPYAQIHYPFENQQKFDQNFPGDYIVEYIAQVRAWFYVMHVLSTCLFGKNSFKNVISTGVMAGSDGRKMSKTYGNYADPKDVLEKIGGDALRLYLMSSPLMVGENANFDEDELKTKLKNVINPLWNSLKFFDMYAKQHKWEPSNLTISENLLDKWILAKLHKFIKQFSENIEKYLIPNAVVPLDEFIDDLSRWYVRRSRDRISSGENEALSTLYQVLFNFSKAAAPIIPFVTEQIYQKLRQPHDVESVHLCNFPSYSDQEITAEEDMFTKMDLVKQLVTLGHAARTKANIPVRQPLSTLFVKKKDDAGLSDEYLDILKDEINIKNVEYTQELPNGDQFISQSMDTLEIKLDTTVNEVLKLEGDLREFIRTVQGLRKSSNLTAGEYVDLVYPSDEKYVQVVFTFEQEIKKKVYAKSISKGIEFKVTKII